MTPEVRAFFFLAAILVWLWETFIGKARVPLTPLGLALFAFPFFWDAADAGWFDS